MSTTIRRYQPGSREVVVTYPASGTWAKVNATFDNLSAAFAWFEANGVDLAQVRGLAAVTDPQNPYNPR